MSNDRAKLTIKPILVQWPTPGHVCIRVYLGSSHMGGLIVLICTVTIYPAFSGHVLSLANSSGIRVHGFTKIGQYFRVFRRV